MSVGKQDATCSQPIEIGSDRLRMSPHAANPVVEIIQRDEENVRPCGFFLRISRNNLCATCKNYKQSHQGFHHRVCSQNFLASSGHVWAMNVARWI